MIDSIFNNLLTLMDIYTKDKVKLAEAVVKKKTKIVSSLEKLKKRLKFI